MPATAASDPPDSENPGRPSGEEPIRSDPGGPGLPTRFVDLPAGAAALRGTKDAHRDPEPPQPQPAGSQPAASQPPESLPPASGKLPAVETMFARGEWGAVCERLAPGGRGAEELPPAHALLYATAKKELGGDETALATRVAIRAMARLLGLPEDSDVPLMLAKRVLRTHVAAQRSAPRARTSMFILAAALVIGGGAGWLAGPGAVNAHEAIDGVKHLVAQLRGG